MTKNPLFYGVLLLVLAVFVTQCCFTVHQTQQALVLQLGDPLPEIYRPGLHFKLPFIQKVVYFDARVLDYAASSREAFTVDKKTIVLDNYARWRISDPLQFYRTMRTIPGAQARLDDVVYSQLRALVGAYTLTEVVSKERATIMARVTEKVSDLMKPYGVEVLDVRIKRTDLPAENQHRGEHQRHVEHIAERTDLNRGKDVVQDDAHAVHAAGNDVVRADEIGVPYRHDQTPQYDGEHRTPPREGSDRFEKRFQIHTHASF